MAKEKVKKEQKNPLNRMMPLYGVYAMTSFERLIVHIVFFIIGGFVGQIFYGGLFSNEYGEATLATNISNLFFFAAIGFAAMKFLVPMYKSNRLEKQQNKLKQQFLALLDAITSSLASGSNVPKSFESAYEDLKLQYTSSDYIVREVKQVIDGIAQNVGIEVILSDFGERSGNEDIISFAEVFATCHKKGGNMQSVIIRTHDSIREKISMGDEIQTKLTSNKMQLNVMSVVPIALVALLRLTNPSFAEAFSTLVGVVVNTVAIGIFVGSYMFGKRIVAIGRT